MDTLTSLPLDADDTLPIPIAIRSPRMTLACRHCGGEIQRSHRRVAERWLLWLGPWRPVRCRACGRRRWRAVEQP